MMLREEEWDQTVYTSTDKEGHQGSMPDICELVSMAVVVWTVDIP